MSDCEHEIFDAVVEVNRITDIGRYSADVRIHCGQCGVEMVFLGLPRGLDVNGAAINIDGTEARLAIHPKGETVAEVPLGFLARRGDDNT